MVPVIAIDGPSGSGKGSIALMVARELGYHVLDSGALYRLLALAAIERAVSADDEPALATAAADLPATFEEGLPGEPARVLLAGKDVGDRIREEDVGQFASRVAAFPAVRAALLARQRAYARAPGLVADGRDMGTVVFPDAPLKIFLDADVEERARRREKQLLGQGVSASFARLVDELRARDDRDRNRPVAPLRPAGDAVVIDSTHLGREAVFQQVMALVRSRSLA
ncbi:MAG: (d)CMP kinase [Gammaproteobacteria bacterium]